MNLQDLKVTRKTVAKSARRVDDNDVIAGYYRQLFTDTARLEKEKSLQQAMLALRKKYGKNAVLKGTNYLEGATMRQRNGLIGGHKAE